MVLENNTGNGVLPAQALERMVADGQIRARTPITADQIQPSSMDLRLGSEAYRVRASFLANGSDTITGKLEQYRLHTIDLTRPAVLEKGCVYIVPLQEELALPADISGKANPKSSTGRLDIFTRLITDEGRKFEVVPAGYRGRLYAEVVPRTFSILLQQGARLNQIRFVRGNPPPSDTKLGLLDQSEPLVYLESDGPQAAVIKDGLWISVDLEGSAASGIVGYRAKNHAPLVDLSKIAYYDTLEFWEPITRTPSRGLVLNPDDFYILASRELIRVPPNYAASMVPYDPSVGEFRIHYAGFFDPGFGYGENDIAGTRAVLEVRSHDVPFLIEHGQDVGRLIYDRLLGVPEKIYGGGIGSSYQRQGLALAKQFKPVAAA